jgi:hypothetical protein
MSFLYPEKDWVFVDQAYTGSSQKGTFLKPYKQFKTGTDKVASGGTVIIQPGDYDGVGLHTKAMTLNAPLGKVTLK